MNMRRMLVVCLACLVVGGSVVLAGEDQALRDRVDALEARLANVEGNGGGPGASWADRISFKGSLRYRHEMVDDEEDDDHENHLHRIQAKIGMAANVTDDVDVVFQFASGGNANNSGVSTNQTLRDGFSTKEINLDLAYFKWTPGDVTVLGGKMKNPFFKPGKTELIWDGDINPEGGAVQYAKPLGDAELFVNAGGFWFDEMDPGVNDQLVAGAQVGVKAEVGGASVTVGGSYFDYGAVKGVAPVDALDGNTDSDPGVGFAYAEDFDMVEGFAQVGTTLGDYPVAIFGDFVVNTACSENNTGYLLGFIVGKCKAPGSKALRYNYRRVEADATIGSVSDSDFGGGGTDAQGHEIGFDYQVANNVKAGITYFKNETILGATEDYERVQLDIKFSF